MILLPRPHRQLLSFLGILILAAIIVWIFVILPLQHQRDDLVSDNSTLTGDLSNRGMPTQPEKLRNLLQNQKLQLDELRQSYNSSWDRAMIQFKPQTDLYDSPRGFRKSITLLDYQELYLSTTNSLNSADVRLSPDILGLSESSSDPRSYRIYTQLLLVRNVAELARKHNLLFHDTDSPKAPKTKSGELAARISALPVRTYITSRDEAPFVEEFSIRCSVTGTTADFAAFIADLTAPDRFIATRQIALEKSGASSPAADRVTGTLVCSAFLMLREKEDTRPPEAEQTIHWQPGT